MKNVIWALLVGLFFGFMLAWISGANNLLVWFLCPLAFSIVMYLAYLAGDIHPSEPTRNLEE